MIKDPMYSMIYHKPEYLVRLKWLAGTAKMTDDDFKETLEAFADTALRHSAKGLLIDVREFKHATTSEAKKSTPVALPPGRPMPATSPIFTGSSPTPKTIGMIAVAALVARAPGELPGTAITAT
jgi:hypothetical protein